MLWMIRDCVDRVYVAAVFIIGWCVSVTFEAEVIAGLLIVDILYGAATFNTTNSETCSVVEAGDDSGLILERGLYSLEEFVGIAEVDNVDVSIGTANDKKLVSHVHGVDSVLTVECRDRVLCPKIPILDLLVPRTSDEVRRAIDCREFGGSDGLFVCG